MHVHAVQKDASTYEHVAPESVGNTRRILISELSGASNIAAKAGKKFDIENDKAAFCASVLEKVQDLENAGLSVRGRRGELRAARPQGDRQRHRKFFELDQYRVSVVQAGRQQAPVSEATVKLTRRRHSRASRRRRGRPGQRPGRCPAQSLASALSRRSIRCI